MDVKITSSGGFENISRWLNTAKEKSLKPTLDSIAEDGVSALRSGTPMGETGETANGWAAKVTETKTGAEVAFVNNAHPGESVNVAKIIELGHATGTGGYVPPRKYIRPALANTFKNFGDKVAKEMFK